ncbi:hypothetical protein [Sphingobium boeckii]|uniref:Polyketide cyclase n=1 Tax=Sphingobium boeckii TaxID=1082345 RepID=A0A7W9EG07_9SPHN|nr:hypothetical protein [Sphingobium boeckii]MBB5687679.1 hypothetical protein [Sphingobium boeckii]
MAGQPARLAWHGWSGEGDSRLDVHHAWLIEGLSGGRVRILTQETQNGAPAKEPAKAMPNPMINGHQEWLDGLVAAARAAKARACDRSSGLSRPSHDIAVIPQDKVVSPA